MAAPWEKYAAPKQQPAAPEQAAPQAKPWERYSGDSVGRIAGQVAGGGVEALLTLPGAVSDLMLLGIDKIGQQFGARPLTAEEYADNPLGSNTVKSMFKDYVSPDLFGGEPRTTGERYARRVGEFLGPGLALGPLNPRTVVSATTGGIGSRAAQDAFPDSIIAPIAGGLVGGLAPSALRSLRSGAPGNMSATNARLATAMQAEGIPIYPAQMGGRATQVAYDAISRLPFMGSGAREAQLKAFNAAIARTFGEKADEITPAVMNQARDRLSKEFNDIFARNSVPFDQQLLTDLGDIQAKVIKNLSTQQADEIGRKLSSLIDDATQNGGVLDGRKYHAYTSRGGALKVLTGSADPNIKFYGGQIREALDDAFSRNAQADDAARLANAKRQWRAMTVIEPLAVKATDGNISPALLLGRVAANDRSLAFSGGGKLGTLARGAKQFLKEPPNSTTADRNLVHAALGGGGVVASVMEPTILTAAAAGWGIGKSMKSLMESRTIGARMVAKALQRAQQSQQGRLRGAARAVVPGAASLAGRQNLPVENRSRVPARN